MYLLARCPKADQEIPYSEERITDLFKMPEPIQCPNGVIVNDTARFSKGILQIASLKLANKREEVSFVHLVPCIQTMVKTYASEIQKK